VGGGGSGKGDKLTAYLYIMPRLRMSGAVAVLTPCAFMTWTGKNLRLVRGGCTVKLMKLKSQGHSLARAPSNVFMRSCVFVKFAKVRYFNHNRLRPLSLSTPSHLPWCWVVLDWPQASIWNFIQHLPLNNIRGQSFDNVAVMKGDDKGFASII